MTDRNQDKFEKEEFGKEQDEMVQKEWSEFKEDKDEKKKEKKELTSLILIDEYKAMIVTWNQVIRKYDKEIDSALFNLFGREGLTGLGRKITDEFIDSDYKEIEAAQESIDFVRDSRRLWVRMNRRHKEYKEMISKLFESNHNCLQLIRKLKERIKEYKEKEEQGPKEEPEEPLSEEEKQVLLGKIKVKMQDYNRFWEQGDYMRTMGVKGSVMSLAGKNKQKKDICANEFDRLKIGKLSDLKKEK